jgi:tRNA threonylcarbamoyladenosine biosynthesis protein TsaB
MKLFIDTSLQEKIVLRLNDESFESEARQPKSQSLLPFIIETLDSKGVALTDLREIEVATGPGSFTGIRVGVSVAQMLGWMLDIPVNNQIMSKDEFIQINYGDSRFN